MTISPVQSILLILVVAGVTLATRMVPFVLFPENKPTPKYILYLGRVLPFATIGMLVVYCLKGVRPTVYPYGIPELIAMVVIGALQLWKHNSLISIGGGTALYMVLVQVVF